MLVPRSQPSSGIRAWKTPKVTAMSQGVADPQAPHLEALAERDGEGVGRDAERDEEEGQERHGVLRAVWIVAAEDLRLHGEASALGAEGLAHPG